MGKAVLRGLFLAMIVCSLSAPAAQATTITALNSDFKWESFGRNSQGDDVGLWISGGPFWFTSRNNDNFPAPVITFIPPIIPTGITSIYGGDRPGCGKGDDGGTNAVPEPTTLLLLGCGLVGLVGLRRKLKKQT